VEACVNNNHNPDYNNNPGSKVHHAGKEVNPSNPKTLAELCYCSIFQLLLLSRLKYLPCTFCGIHVCRDVVPQAAAYLVRDRPEEPALRAFSVSHVI
jgi:hypothetical protein